MASADFSSESSDASTTLILCRKITTNSSEESTTSSEDFESVHTPQCSNSTVLGSSSSITVHPFTPVHQNLPEDQHEGVEPSDVQVGPGYVGVGSAQNDVGNSSFTGILPGENNVMLDNNNEVVANNKKKRQINIDYFIAKFLFYYI